MPEAVERLDDRTFFILYALTKRLSLTIDYIHRLYPDKSIIEILKEFDFFCEILPISINLSYNVDYSLDEDKIEKIEQRKEKLEYLINNGLQINGCSAMELKLLPYVLKCNFECSEKDDVKARLDDYCVNSIASRKKYYSSDERHHDVFKRVCQWAKHEIGTAPYKVGLDRFLECVKDKNKSKYAIFHFLYQLESAGSIYVEELSFQADYPFIIFTPLKEKIHKPKVVAPNGDEICHYELLYLFENGILNSAQPNNFVKCEDLEVKLLKLFLSHPIRKHSYQEIDDLFGGTVDFQKKISRVRSKLKKACSPNGAHYNIEKVSGEKAYKILFTKK